MLSNYYVWLERRIFLPEQCFISYLLMNEDDGVVSCSNTCIGILPNNPIKFLMPGDKGNCLWRKLHASKVRWASTRMEDNLLDPSDKEAGREEQFSSTFDLVWHVSCAIIPHFTLMATNCFVDQKIIRSSLVYTTQFSTTHKLASWESVIYWSIY